MISSHSNRGSILITTLILGSIIGFQFHHLVKGLSFIQKTTQLNTVSIKAHYASISGIAIGKKKCDTLLTQAPIKNKAWIYTHLHLGTSQQIDPETIITLFKTPTRLFSVAIVDSSYKSIHTLTYEVKNKVCLFK